VQMQHANQKLPSTEGRSMSRKRKNDASKIVDEWTKKQCETPRAQQVGYSEHKQQPLTKMSHTHRDFFVSLSPPSFGRTQAPTYKKCYNYIERGHLISQCLNPRQPPTPTPTRILLQTQRQGSKTYFQLRTRWSFCKIGVPIGFNNDHYNSRNNSNTIS
jgi:hypothetical protein